MYYVVYVCSKKELLLKWSQLASWAEYSKQASKQLLIWKVQETEYVLFFVDVIFLMLFCCMYLYTTELTN